MISSFTRMATSGLMSRTALTSTGRAATNAFFKSSTTTTKTNCRLFSSIPLSASNNRWKWALGGGVVTTSLLQAKYGHTSDFYEYRFTTTKDPDDIAGFYGGEEFMELFCVMPLVGQIMMRGGTFDDEGTVHTQGLPGELQVSMVFSDEYDSTEERTLWFNKRERFKDVFLGNKMWDMVTNFGFETLPDGRVKCYHTGEYFHGNIPPLSLLLRLVFYVHAQYVGWATEQYINTVAFCSETDEQEEVEHEARTFFLNHLIKNVYWGGLKAKLGGGDKKDRKRATYNPADYSTEKDLSKVVVEKDETPTVVVPPTTLTIQPMLTIQRHSTLSKIEEDIQMDKVLLRRQSSIKMNDNGDDDVHPRPTGVTAYRHATVAARQRQQSRRRMSLRKMKSEENTTDTAPAES